MKERNKKIILAISFLPIISIICYSIFEGILAYSNGYQIFDLFPVYGIKGTLQCILGTAFVLICYTPNSLVLLICLIYQIIYFKKEKKEKSKSE